MALMSPLPASPMPVLVCPSSSTPPQVTVSPYHCEVCPTIAM